MHMQVVLAACMQMHKCICSTPALATAKPCSDCCQNWSVVGTAGDSIHGSIALHSDRPQHASTWHLRRPVMSEVLEVSGRMCVQETAVPGQPSQTSTPQSPPHSSQSPAKALNKECLFCESGSGSKSALAMWHTQLLSGPSFSIPSLTTIWETFSANNCTQNRPRFARRSSFRFYAYLVWAVEHTWVVWTFVAPPCVMPVPCDAAAVAQQWL